MATNYPAAQDTTTELPNNQTDATATDRAGVDHAAEHVNISDAIRAIEGELGNVPKGTFSNVAARLAARSTVRLTADSTGFTTQVLANATGLSFSVAASQDYYFKFFIPVTLGVARGAGVGITCPAAPTSIFYQARIMNVTASTETIGFGFASAAAITSAASATTNGIILVEGTLANGTTAGTLQVQLRQGTGATAVNVVAKKGAYGEMYLN